MNLEVDYQYLKFSQLENTTFWDYYTLSNTNVIASLYPLVKLRDVLVQRKTSIIIDDNKLYKRCRVQIRARGVALRDEVFGSEIKIKKQQVCKTDDFLVAEIDAKVGGYGIIPENLEGAIVSSHYFLFEIDRAKLSPEYLGIIIKQEQFSRQIKSTGSTNYAAIRPYHVLGYEIPLPPLTEQVKIVSDYYKAINQSKQINERITQLEIGIKEYIFKELGLNNSSGRLRKKGLQVVLFNSISEWGLDKIISSSNNHSKHFNVVSISNRPDIAVNIFRGKSPRYSSKTGAFILNQKCNRWNEIDLQFSKTVDKTWFDSIDKEILTRVGDVLINSTGEGTIGRASYITENHQGLLYDSHILLLRLNVSVIDPELFVELFNSSYGQNQVNDIKSAQATKQTELGISNLKKVFIPLPESLEFQKTMVTHIKNIRTQIFQLKSKSDTIEMIAKSEFQKILFAK
ncbi:restriction endonuclease subunit S [Mucilaginibacter panaciglaebae]|uniref:Restriction endonuclease subunit S n=1 Tax=Mucilaginibacter panaciglaebae TaxID=502331 RepID=A0ABP7WZC3_9SPHI